MYRYIKSSTVKASKGSCMDMLNAFRKRSRSLKLQLPLWERARKRLSSTET